MADELTIDELARETGMTVRNIRAHQARGLLDPPEVRARVGYYGPEHVEQLRLIRDLQEDGFNLGAIKRLIDDTQGTAERLQRHASEQDCRNRNQFACVRHHPFLPQFGAWRAMPRCADPIIPPTPGARLRRAP